MWFSFTTIFLLPLFSLSLDYSFAHSPPFQRFRFHEIALSKGKKEESAKEEVLRGRLLLFIATNSILQKNKINFLSPLKKQLEE